MTHAMAPSVLTLNVLYSVAVVIFDRSSVLLLQVGMGAWWSSISRVIDRGMKCINLVMFHSD